MEQSKRKNESKKPSRQLHIKISKQSQSTVGYESDIASLTGVGGLIQVFYLKHRGGLPKRFSTAFRNQIPLPIYPKSHQIYVITKAEVVSPKG